MKTRLPPHHPMMRRIIAIIVIVFSPAFAGCASIDKDTPTAGLELTMYVRDATGAETYYHVQRDGTLGFGGGLKARLFQTTWADQMSPQEIQQLRALLQARNFFKPVPASTNQPPEYVYRISINAPENRKQFRVKGESEAVRPIQQFLRQISLRRLEPALRSLPQPSRNVQQSQPSDGSPPNP